MAQLYFKYGTMNSGKSFEVLKVAHNYEEQGKSVHIFSPAIDSRSGTGKVVSRVESMAREVTPLSDTDNIYKLIREKHDENLIDCVLVDECQFLTREQAYQCARIVDELDIPVMVFGLKNDYENQLFEGSETFLLIADKFEEVKTICWYCAKKATMNLRTNTQLDGQVALGGNDDYKAVCRKHYMTLHKPIVQ